MKGYIHELVDNLKEGCDKQDKVKIELNIEPLEMDISKSIPIGLMLNEAITNSLKYAFNNNSENRIHISLKKEAENEFFLIIKDNGKGLPPGLDPTKSTTLGLKLINGLCKQIKAKFSIESNNGVCIIIRFRSTIDTEDPVNEAIFEND